LETAENHGMEQHFLRAVPDIETGSKSNTAIIKSTEQKGMKQSRKRIHTSPESQQESDGIKKTDNTKPSSMRKYLSVYVYFV
jgi:hypothetical protein